MVVKLTDQSTHALSSRLSPHASTEYAWAYWQENIVSRFSGHDMRCSARADPRIGVSEIAKNTIYINPQRHLCGIF